MDAPSGAPTEGYCEEAFRRQNRRRIGPVEAPRALSLRRDQVKAWVNPGRGGSGKQNTVIEPFGTFRGMCLGRNGRVADSQIATLSHTLRGLTHTSTDSETRVFTLLLRYTGTATLGTKGL